MIRPIDSGPKTVDSSSKPRTQKEAQNNEPSKTGNCGTCTFQKDDSTGGMSEGSLNALSWCQYAICSVSQFLHHHEWASATSRKNSAHKHETDHNRSTCWSLQIQFNTTRMQLHTTHPVADWPVKASCSSPSRWTHLPCCVFTCLFVCLRAGLVGVLVKESFQSF